MDKLSDSIVRVQAALAALHLTYAAVELPAATRTAPEAAAALECNIAQIAKSIVFRRLDNDEPVVVITSGINRVDEELLAAHLQCEVKKANAQFVRSATGFAIGGVAPLGFERPVQVLFDANLLQYQQVWAAAGTPHAVFAMVPADFTAATGIEVASIAVPMNS